MLGHVDVTLQQLSVEICHLDFLKCDENLPAELLERADCALCSDEKMFTRCGHGLHSATGPAERTFRVVMCGEAAVGKSSLVMRLVSGKHCDNLPSTLGEDCQP
ncbi:hypothetical protein NECAME_07883 [Necator americanus]|uniref:Ras family protein n=1 Tax=Necator americanus TaxID=51031 RepID=W2TL80_NECAM|nr:hypothetical protein NECAME_07883 [Necator americanus]ETN82548.1 hypothetical protein NECAME_07883 [Necator americanus]